MSAADVFAAAHDAVRPGDDVRNIWDAHGLVVRVAVQDPFRSIPVISAAIREALALTAAPFEPSRRGWRGGAPPGEATRPRTQAEQPCGGESEPPGHEQT